MFFVFLKTEDAGDRRREKLFLPSTDGYQSSRNCVDRRETLNGCLSFRSNRAFAGEDGISGRPRLFKTTTLKFWLLGLASGCNPSPMLREVSDTCNTHMPLSAFNHGPQSEGLGLTSHGAYTFPTHLVRISPHWS